METCYRIEILKGAEKLGIPEEIIGEIFQATKEKLNVKGYEFEAYKIYYENQNIWVHCRYAQVVGFD